MVLALLSVNLTAGDVYPLSPKAFYDRGIVPRSDLDQEYAVQHHDGEAEYYLGSGAINDTFFIAFEPPAACIVKWVEVEWYNDGNVNAFAAWYSDEAAALYEGGIAPERGQSPVSPIGDWITNQVPNSIPGYGWATLDLDGTEWIVGDSVTLSSDVFGVGWIKLADLPQCLADGMNAKGIYHSYSWFGGPWVIGLGYDNPWGAYSSNYGSTVIDVMMTVWVEYPWGMPILISDLFQKCNTFDDVGPYTITCALVDDDPGITSADYVKLVYEVDGGTPDSLTLVETAPGSGIFAADIPGQAIGSEVSYWVYTVDDVGLINSTFSKSFMVIEPDHPDADVLFIDDNTSDRYTAYQWAIDVAGYYFETWDASANMGIDESVVEYGWSSIIVGAWGTSVIPALDDANAFANFLDGGGNLALFDQDYFYGNGLPATGSFASGDFAYDYFGLNEYWNDPDVADSIYMGESGDPIAGDFETEYFMTYWDTLGVHMTPGSFWADYVTEGAADPIFYGVNDGYVYGCKYDNGFKTVFLSFMAEAGGGQGITVFVPNDQFITLMDNTLEWFGAVSVPSEGGEYTPSAYALAQNYPNPFNSSTLIAFTLENAGITTLKVYNMMGQEVATLIDQNLQAGPYAVQYDAASLSSGMYYYKLNSGDFQAVKTMLLVK